MPVIVANRQRSKYAVSTREFQYDLPAVLARDDADLHGNWVGTANDQPRPRELDPARTRHVKIDFVVSLQPPWRKGSDRASDIVAIARTWSTTSVFPPPLSFSSIAYRKWFEGDWKSHPETVMENLSVS